MHDDLCVAADKAIGIILDIIGVVVLIVVLVCIGICVVVCIQRKQETDRRKVLY